MDQSKKDRLSSRLVDRHLRTLWKTPAPLLLLWVLRTGWYKNCQWWSNSICQAGGLVARIRSFHHYELGSIPSQGKCVLGGLTGGASSKEPACQCRRHKKCGFNPWRLKCRRIPWRRNWQPTLVLLLGESHGQRSLAGLGLLCSYYW